jgi:hypothetical protein
MSPRKPFCYKFHSFKEIRSFTAVFKRSANISLLPTHYQLVPYAMVHFNIILPPMLILKRFQIWRENCYAFFSPHIPLIHSFCLLGPVIFGEEYKLQSPSLCIS